MRAETLARRYRMRMDAAVYAARNGMSLRKVEKTFGLPRSTVHRVMQLSIRACQVPGLPRNPAGRPPTFSTAEEKKLPEERQSRLPFREGRPGRKFTHGFLQRHSARLRFSKPVLQEGKRFAAANADALTMHYATLGRLIEEHDLDAARIWNLDETGGTPGKDVSGAGASRRFLRRDGIVDAKIAHFANVSRSTMMPIINAAGEAGPVLFVFKGKALPYRNVLRGGSIRSETLASYLPRGAMLACREECGGVDAANFLNWSKAFVESVRDLTANGRKVLLTYDGYRSHMSLAVLELFQSNGIVIYALPAHTSGKTQPCDAVLFSTYKAQLNESLTLAASTDGIDILDEYSYCGMMRRAYEKSFTRENIQSSFAKTGFGHLTHRASSLFPVLAVLTMSATSSMSMSYKRSSKRKSGLCAHRLSATMPASTAVSTSDTAKRKEKELKAIRKSLVDARREQTEREDIQKRESARWRERARLSNMSVKDLKLSVRPIKERRAIAKLRFALRKNVPNLGDAPLPYFGGSCTSIFERVDRRADKRTVIVKNFDNKA
eukprot:IDg1354t1